MKCDVKGTFVRQSTKNVLLTTFLKLNKVLPPSFSAVHSCSVQQQGNTNVPSGSVKLFHLYGYLDFNPLYSLRLRKSQHITPGLKWLPLLAPSAIIEWTPKVSLKSLKHLIVWLASIFVTCLLTSVRSSQVIRWWFFSPSVDRSWNPKTFPPCFFLESWKDFFEAVGFICIKWKW